jgi:DNA-binding NarL/FixJ family response regulator
MKRLVVVADNSLIVEAIALGLQKSGDFKVVGHVSPRSGCARAIAEATPDVVLVDDVGHPSQVAELIAELKIEDDRIAILVLTMRMDPDWLEAIFYAGAIGAISKTAHPVALATLVRETINGNMVHLSKARGALDGSPTTTLTSADSTLTRRELEVLQLVAAGSTNAEIARKLWVTEQTVKFHLSNVYRKLRVGNRTEASHYAHLNGLVATVPGTA